MIGRGTKIENPYIEFVQVADTGKTLKIAVMSKASKASLGTIHWYGPWRRYAFFPTPSTVFDLDCLCSIAGFMSGLMDARRGKEEHGRRI